jgi:hypothetical protein
MEDSAWTARSTLLEGLDDLIKRKKVGVVGTFI